MTTELEGIPVGRVSDETRQEPSRRAADTFHHENMFQLPR